MVIDYQNPVWEGYMADPFVLRWNGQYYAYGTNPAFFDSADHGGFQVLRSPDLVHWESCGGCLEIAARGELGAYWAPEVAERDGNFYMYYSSSPPGGDEGHRLHVAIAESPTGPFRTVDHPLLQTDEPAIDAHPFLDPRDGQWYLFFAKDFFDSRVGTALAVVRLGDDMVSTEGLPITALRASDDWQVYERNRFHYGKHWDAWHTVEGPAVVYHDAAYYLLYSGGNWQTDNYGVGYAISDCVMGPYIEPETGPVILKTVPQRIIGPGHNCVVSAVDGRSDFIVYHAWDTDRTARRMCIDPLQWTADGPRCVGPTATRQVLELDASLPGHPA